MRDLAPIVIVIAFFEFAVLRQVPDGLFGIVIGVIVVVIGLTFFIYGLELALFPIGDALAIALAKKGSAFWLLVFAFLLGFGTTIAEPALTAIANEAGQIAADAGAIEDTDEARENYVLGLRITVALSVGTALILGVLRIIFGWSLPLMIISGYVIVVGMTAIAPADIIGVAYDSGGVTTSTVTVPLVTALGVGLASSLRDRNPMTDGFGLCIANTDDFRHGLRRDNPVDLIVSSIMTIVGTGADVLPIVLFIFLFQTLVIRQPLPNFKRLLAGLGFVILGLGLFLIGLEQALFPLGREMAAQLTSPDALVGGAAQDWTSYAWVYVFALSIGFATTIAEPALLAVSMKAHDVSGGAISVWGLRVAVALGVAVGVALGTYRIITGTPLQYFIMVAYVVVVIQTILAPKLIIALAYDSGGVTTSTVTVPLITALGLGLAETIPGRSPLLDGFGLVAFASVFPIIAVLTYAQLSEWMERRAGERRKKEEREDSDLVEEN